MCKRKSHCNHCADVVLLNTGGSPQLLPLNQMLSAVAFQKFIHTRKTSLCSHLIFCCTQ